MTKKEQMSARKLHIKLIKEQIKKGTYDWKKAIEDTANKIVEYPQALLWK